MSLSSFCQMGHTAGALEIWIVGSRFLLDLVFKLGIVMQSIVNQRKMKIFDENTES